MTKNNLDNQKRSNIGILQIIYKTIILKNMRYINKIWKDNTPQNCSSILEELN